MELAPYRRKYRIATELSLDLADWPSVPDLSISAFHPIDLKNDVIAVTVPPLCVVEIISPSQSINELVSKADKYFAHGVKSCWLVIPNLGNIYVFSSPDDYQMFRKEETLRDETLDISLPLDQVFA
jgi:Uma2 family endonuclease